MKTRNNKSSPLGRWLSSSPSTDRALYREQAHSSEPDPVDVAHWIMFGVIPSDEDARYWCQQVKDGSLYDFLQSMYDASAPSIPTDWEKLSRFFNSSTSRSGRGAVSPTMTIIHIYQEAGVPVPGMQKILRHLQAILRRPTDTLDFVRHIERGIYRTRARKEDSRGFRILARSPISKAVILNEILLIENSLRPARDKRTLNIISRALSPFPTFSRKPSDDSPASQDPRSEFQEIIRSTGIDLAVVERALQSALASCKTLEPKEKAQKVVGIFCHAFGSESAESLVVALYCLLLGREPDQDGFRHYVEMLKSGAMDNSDVIVEIFVSDECQAAKHMRGGSD